MYFKPLTRDERNLIYNDIQTTEEGIQNDVQYLMEWLEKQPHLPNVTDKKLLANAIIRCKNRLELVKHKLNAYYTTRAIMEDIFTDRDPTTDEFKNAMMFAPCAPMPELTEDGYRIVVYQLFRNFKNSPPDCSLLLKTIQMQLDVSLKEDITRGVIFVYDFSGASTAHIGYLLSFIKRYITLLKGAITFRYHKIYFLNAASALEPVINFSKHFMKKEIAGRFVVWNRKQNELGDVLPKHLLPSDYGGYHKSFDEIQENWCKFVQLHKDWLISEEKVKADLTRIPADKLPPKDDSTYGLDGSFRKINLD